MSHVWKRRRPQGPQVVSAAWRPQSELKELRELDELELELESESEPLEPVQLFQLLVCLHRRRRWRAACQLSGHESPFGQVFGSLIWACARGLGAACGMGELVVRALGLPLAVRRAFCCVVQVKRNGPQSKESG